MGLRITVKNNKRRVPIRAIFFIDRKKIQTDLKPFIYPFKNPLDNRLYRYRSERYREI